MYREVELVFSSFSPFFSFSASYVLKFLYLLPPYVIPHCHSITVKCLNASLHMGCIAGCLENIVSASAFIFSTLKDRDTSVKYETKPV